MKTTLIVSHYDYESGTAKKISGAEYRRRYRAAVREYGNVKAQVDDGEGGAAWKFFASPYDLDLWREQR